MLDFDADYDPDQRSALEPQPTKPSSSNIPTNVPEKQGNLDLTKSFSYFDGESSNQHADQCRCLQHTAVLLEELCARNVTQDSNTTGVSLAQFRDAITKCSTIINCNHCTSASENSMLLAMATQYMSSICERIVQSYTTRQATVRRRDVLSSPTTSHDPGAATYYNWAQVPAVAENDGEPELTTGGTPPSSSDPSDEEVYFSAYRVRTAHERLQVLRCIITVQLAEFWRLLQRLKARDGNRQGHVALLSETESRTRNMRDALKQSPSRSFQAK